MAELSERTIRGLACAEVECEKLWGFCYCKRVTERSREWRSQVGDIYHYLAIDRNTKLILASAFGKRDTETAVHFMQKLKKAATKIGELSTDGWPSFPDIVSLLWGKEINYGQIVKILAGRPGKDAASHYSSGKITEIHRAAIIGEPNIKRIGTSFAERVNLSIRMGNRRMTRLTNGFSKKWANHEVMMNLFLGVYNFCKAHGTLKTSPAVTAGLADHVWTIRQWIDSTSIQTH